MAFRWPPRTAMAVMRLQVEPARLRPGAASKRERSFPGRGRAGFDPAVMLLHDAKNRRQPQARSFANVLGGKKWF